MNDWREVRLAEGDIWAGYDPARVKAASWKSAGALARIDRQKLLKDIGQERSQEIMGRLG